MSTGKSSAVLRRAVVSGLCLLGAGVDARAAADSAGGLEEVIVTARRVSESLQNAPLAVTAISTQTIEDYRLQNMESFASLSPNAYVPKDSYNQNTRISIRGGRDVDPQVEPDFGLYRNGDYYGGPRTNLGDLVDVERVEVLRGPQVALYGRNALNGAVNVVFATPDHTKDAAFLSAEYGTYDHADFQGWINAPVSDTFALRAAGWYVSQQNGPHYNPILHQNMDTFHDQGMRLSADWKPVSDLDILWVAETDSGSGPDSTEFIASPRCVGLLAPYGICGHLPAEKPNTILRNTPTSADTQTYYLSQDINWHTGYGTLGLYANYRDYHRDGTRDFDETPFSPSDFPGALQQVNNNKDGVYGTNVDLRWTSVQGQRFTWMLGASYLNETMNVNRQFITSLDLTLFQPFLPPSLGVPPGLGVNTATGKDDININTKSWSGYGELTFAATPKLDLIAGGRYTDEKKDLKFNQYVVTDGTPGSYVLSLLFAGTFPSYSNVDSHTFTNFSPMGTITYKFTDDVNSYALVSKGFRAGSYNTTATSAAYLPYDSETGINYELGLKSMLWERRLRLNFAAFMFDVDNLLLRVLDPQNPLQFSYLQNSGKSRTYGIEGEAEVEPVTGLNIGLSVGWLDAKITEGYSSDQNIANAGPGAPGVVCNPPTGSANCKTDISGSPIPGARDWTLALLANYKHPLTDTVGWFVNGSWRYQTGGYWSATPKYEQPGSTPPTKIDTVNVLDLSLGLESDRYRFIFFANNITNNMPITTLRIDQIDVMQGTTYGVRVTARY